MGELEQLSLFSRLVPGIAPGSVRRLPISGDGDRLSPARCVGAFEGVFGHATVFADQERQVRLAG